MNCQDANDEMDYEILGFKVRLKPTEKGNKQARSSIDLVAKEVEEIKRATPHLNNGQIAVLVALKISADKLNLEEDFKNSINEFQNVAVDAHRLIEEISPKTM